MPRNCLGDDLSECAPEPVTRFSVKAAALDGTSNGDYASTLRKSHECGYWVVCGITTQGSVVRGHA